GAVTCDLGNFDPAQNKQVVLQAKVAIGASKLLFNTAGVFAVETDLDDHNNSVTISTAVEYDTFLPMIVSKSN
ncbi:MAG: hypothetical protein P8016_15615, partial [Sedimentisphaerales bacterium]